MRGLLELRGLFEGGSYMRKYGIQYAVAGHLRAEELLSSCAFVQT